MLWQGHIQARRGHCSRSNCQSLHVFKLTIHHNKKNVCVMFGTALSGVTFPFCLFLNYIFLKIFEAYIENKLQIFDQILANILIFFMNIWSYCP